VPNESYDLGFAQCPIFEPDVQSAAIGPSVEPPLLLHSDPDKLFEHLNERMGLDAVLGMAEIAAWAAAPARAVGRFDVRTPHRSLDEMFACATNEKERQAIRTAMFRSVMDVIDHLLPDREPHAQFRSMLDFLSVNSTYQGPYSEGGALCPGFALASPTGATMSEVEGGIGTLSDHPALYFPMHFALNGLPEWASPYEELNDGGLSRNVTFLGTPEQTQSDFEGCVREEVPDSPSFNLSISSLRDPDLAPSGKHAASSFAFYAPVGATHDDQARLRDLMADRMMAKLTRLAPTSPTWSSASSTIPPAPTSGCSTAREAISVTACCSLSSWATSVPGPAVGRTTRCRSRASTCVAPPAKAARGSPSFRAATAATKCWTGPPPPDHRSICSYPCDAIARSGPGAYGDVVVLGRFVCSATAFWPNQWGSGHDEGGDLWVDVVIPSSCRWSPSGESRWPSSVANW
jgi:hypothetical protein